MTMKYLDWKEEKINDFSEKNISDLYDRGFVFTRLNKEVMHQTRSVRIDLGKFEPSSENRRILRKGEHITLEKYPIPYSKYSWEIGKLAKDFYDAKADNAFSANKIKELITTANNFNILLIFSNSLSSPPDTPSGNITNLGYAICHKNKTILHYSYPFYDLEKSPKDMGLIMMTKTIVEAKTSGLKYVYLGSLQRPNDVYKLQFSGIEWFDGKEWRNNVEEVKDILDKVN